MVMSYYCSYLGYSPNRDGFDKCCIYPDNTYMEKFPQLVYVADPDLNRSDRKRVIESYMGCDQFEPNGIAAHPSVIEVLSQYNPKTSEIPCDETATKTSWDFELNQVIPHATEVPRELIGR